MNYKERKLSHYPYKIHLEFGFILQALMNNTIDPEMLWLNAPWRDEYDKMANKDSCALPGANQHFVNGKISEILIITMFT